MALGAAVRQVSQNQLDEHRLYYARKYERDLCMDLDCHYSNGSCLLQPHAGLLAGMLSPCISHQCMLRHF